MIIFMIRMCGVIAMFWTNWVIALLALILTGTVNGTNYKGRAIIKDSNARVAVEVVTAFVGIIGIWFFPLIPSEVAHIAAVIAAVYVAYDFIPLLNMPQRKTRR